MPEFYPLPKSEKLSALTALILLAYGLMRMIELPTLEAELSVLGLLIEISFRAQTMMLILCAALAVAGTDWLIQDHPQRQQRIYAAEHWIIPALAAVALGVILVRIPDGPPQWIGMILGAILLIAFLSAEYIVFDPGDARYGVVVSGLYGLALLLLAGTFFAMQTVGLRALYSGPIVFFASAAISGRLFLLAFPGKPTWVWAAIVGILTAQISLGLHYWPLSPLQTALLLTLLTYWLQQMISAHITHGMTRTDLWENSIIAVLGTAVIILFA